MFPTLLAAAGDPDVTHKLLNGCTVGGKTFKVHLDGYNMIPYVTGAAKESPRNAIMYFSGLWDQAVQWFRRAIEANRNYPRSHFGLGAALAELGRVDEARSAVKAGLAVNPTFTLSLARATWPARSDDPTYLAQLDRFFAGMRKAGVPEQ
jgi:tetratricopeptide (TPR) repeat protein